MESKALTNSGLNELYATYFDSLVHERGKTPDSSESDEEDSRKALLSAVDGLSVSATSSSDSEPPSRLRSSSSSYLSSLPAPALVEHLRELSKKSTFQRETIYKKEEELIQYKLYQDILSTNLKEKEKRLEQLLGNRLDELSMQELERDEMLHYEALKRIARAKQVLEQEAVRQLQQERDELVNKQRCKVCFEENAKVLAMPCRHLALCAACAPKTATCVICRAEISQKLEVFS